MCVYLGCVRRKTRARLKMQVCIQMNVYIYMYMYMYIYIYIEMSTDICMCVFGCVYAGRMRRKNRARDLGHVADAL